MAILPLADLTVLEFTPHRDGAVLRRGAGRSRRRRDPRGAGAGRRPHAPAARLRHRLLRLFQPQQALHLHRPEIARGARGGARPGAPRRCADREFRARHDGSARPRLGRGARAEPAADLLRDEGLSAGTLRASAVARRDRAVHDRPRLHDRTARAAVARRLVGDRHHGRRDGRARRARGAAPARPRRQGPQGDQRAVRIVRRSWWRSTWPARQRPARRRRRCRRAAVPGESTRHSRPGTARSCSSASRRTTTGAASAQSSNAPICSPTRASPPTPSGCANRPALREIVAAIVAGIRHRDAGAHDGCRRTSRSRRCARRRICSTIRSSTRTGGCCRSACRRATWRSCRPLPICFDDEAPALRRQPPAAGEHTDAILNALGYSAERIAALRDAKAIS